MLAISSTGVDRVIAIVLQQIDLAAVVTEALQQIRWWTQVVLDQVELGRVIDEALDKVDLTEIVLQKVDLIGVAEYVVEGIDLPEIIRDSTLSSGFLRGRLWKLRMQGVDADQAVARIADRILHRRCLGSRARPPRSRRRRRSRRNRCRGGSLSHERGTGPA